MQTEQVLQSSRRKALCSSSILAQQPPDMPASFAQSCTWGHAISVFSNFCVPDVQAAVCSHLAQLGLSHTTCAVAAQDMAFEDPNIASAPAAGEPGITAFNVSQEDFQVITGPDLASTWLALHDKW